MMFMVLCNPEKSMIRLYDITSLRASGTLRFWASWGHPLPVHTPLGYKALWRHHHHHPHPFHRAWGVPEHWTSQVCPYSHSPLQGYEPHRNLLIPISPLGNKAFAGHTHSMPVSSVCAIFPAWGISWAQSILEPPQPHSPPSVMSSSRAHCPPLLRHETSWGLLHALSPLPGPLAPQHTGHCKALSICCSPDPSPSPIHSAPLSMGSQNSQPPLPIHTALCKGADNTLQLVLSTFLNFSSCCPP